MLMSLALASSLAVVYTHKPGYSPFIEDACAGAQG